MIDNPHAPRHIGLTMDDRPNPARSTSSYRERSPWLTDKMIEDDHTVTKVVLIIAALATIVATGGTLAYSLLFNLAS